jgi:hypothetical protein
MIKGGSTLRLQATLLFSQEVNSTFEAVEGAVEAFLGVRKVGG